MTDKEARGVLGDVSAYLSSRAILENEMFAGHTFTDICNAIKTLEQGDVLDKIRAEILDEAEYAYADFDKYKEDILHAESDELPDDDFRYGMERAVEIINKYRVESEE